MSNIFYSKFFFRQAETLEDNFNVLILQQLMGSTFQLCISGYNTLLVRITMYECNECL